MTFILVSLADRMRVGWCRNERGESSSDGCSENPECFSLELQAGLAEIGHCVFNTLLCSVTAIFRRCQQRLPSWN